MLSDKVKKALAEQLMLDEADIKDESRLVEDLGADSLDLVQLLILLEKEYSVTFEEDEIKDVKTVGDIIGFLQKHIG